MSAAALAAGTPVTPATPATPATRQPRTDYRVASAVKKSLLKIQDKASAVWSEVKRMQRTIDELRAENARLQAMVDESFLQEQCLFACDNVRHCLRERLRSDLLGLP